MRGEKTRRISAKKLKQFVMKGEVKEEEQTNLIKERAQNKMEKRKERVKDKGKERNSVEEESEKETS